MSSEIVQVQVDGFLAPVVDVKTAISRYNAVKEFIKYAFREGVDYGNIPGGNKPVLLKPGAEKLCAIFGLTPRIASVEAVEDWTGEQHGGEPFFYYRYRVVLFRGDKPVAEAEGSANSWEKKYRYRNAELTCPVCGKQAIIKSKYGGGYVCFTKKGGCGAKFADNAHEIVNQSVGVIKNPDPADLPNTLQKIAQKRALLAAVLIATGTSGDFTQDMDEFVETEWFVDEQGMTIAEAGQVMVSTASGMHKMIDFADDPEKLRIIAASAKDGTVREAARVLLEGYQSREEGGEQ